MSFENVPWRIDDGIRATNISSIGIYNPGPRSFGSMNGNSSATVVGSVAIASDLIVGYLIRQSLQNTLR